MQIAPCGIDCHLCAAYQREKNKCFGCNCTGKNIAKHCTVCQIKNCEERLKEGHKFCYPCKKYPCLRLKKLDLRYRTKYRMSMLENQSAIKKHGIRKFILLNTKKWTCKKCGSLLCVHKKECLNCGDK